MYDYCNGNKKIKESTLTETYYSVEKEGYIFHKEECLDTYYNYEERIPINYCPMCGSQLRKEGDNNVS